VLVVEDGVGIIMGVEGGICVMSKAGGGTLSFVAISKMSSK
jgi:hypothetical protein